MKINPVDPRLFGLHPSTKINQTGAHAYEIVIQRKSRIIMKDGKNILTKVAAIHALFPRAIVGVKTTAPVCSKTKNFLQEHHVSIAPLHIRE